MDPLMVSPNQVASMWNLVDTETNDTDTLAAILGLNDHRDNARSAILLDFYCYILLFAKENHLDNEKTSLIITLLKQFHETSMENKLDVTQSYNLFKQLILRYCIVTAVQEPPALQQIKSHPPTLTPSEVRAITEFLTSSYFQHYPLYFHVFTQQQEVHEEHQFVFVETAVTPPPLSKAFTEQDWEFYQSKEHQKRIADELNQIKTNMESVHDDLKNDIPSATDDFVEDKSIPLSHSSHPAGHSAANHPANIYPSNTYPAMPPSAHPSSHYPQFHSHVTVSQAETQKIFESVQQAASTQIIQLRDTLQKQFEEQEKQIIDLIARVDNELQSDNAKSNERKRTPIKPPNQTLPSITSRPSTSTPKNTLASSSSSLSVYDPP